MSWTRRPVGGRLDGRKMLCVEPGAEPKTSSQRRARLAALWWVEPARAGFQGWEPRAQHPARPTRESPPCLGWCIFLVSHRTPRSLMSAVCCSPLPRLWVPGSVEVGTECWARLVSQLSGQHGMPAWEAGGAPSHLGLG